MQTGLQIRQSTERCPVCGEPICYGSVPMAGREFRLNCRCENERLEKERRERVASGEAAIRAEMRRSSGMPGKYRSASLETFRPAKGQGKAYRTAVDFADRFCENRHTGGVCFTGGVGSGKTYLAAAVAGTVIDRLHIPAWEAERVADGNPVKSPPVRFITAVELFEGLKNGYKTCEAGLMEGYKTAPLLILDDLGAEKPTDWTKERLFEIIDYRYSRELPVILTTNLKTGILKQELGERISDRIREMCVLAPVTADSQRKQADGTNPTQGKEW